MSVPEPARSLTADECRALGKRILSFVEKGSTLVRIESAGDGGIRWGRNMVSAAHDSTNHRITITRSVDGRRAEAVTNQLDDASLKDALAKADQLIVVQGKGKPSTFLPPQQYVAAELHSAASAALSAADRSSIAYRSVVEPAIQAGNAAAGYLSATDKTTCLVNNSGLFSFFSETLAEYSTTVRNAAKNASGWAGMSTWDWNKIDPAALGARALHKCEASANPVAIEPGRYTAILEPQAVADLMLLLVFTTNWDRAGAERGNSAWSGPAKESTLLGQQVMDRRINVFSDPADPDGGFRPFSLTGEPYERTVWIENGILKNLAYSRDYARQKLKTDAQILAPDCFAFHMTGGESSVDEMVASAERAVLVTRFTHLQLRDWKSATMSGSTRDGLWLVERGKISKPIRNFRFTQSPLHVFNAVEMLGKPVRVFNPGSLFGLSLPFVVPPMRVRDFNFTSTVDSV